MAGHIPNEGFPSCFYEGRQQLQPWEYTGLKCQEVLLSRRYQVALVGVCAVPGKVLSENIETMLSI
ncbi:hypothetical protein OUZ56_004071 [Daphnia magna]|uniref:Uncharacterized protein n=1 Tax=Daphnia magna TaxID=35525 RepID=A0ABQ9YNP8_9CRUS|nr:hypothetical protein OUZ56_004071 [Daphnia magna]